MRYGIFFGREKSAYCAVGSYQRCSQFLSLRCRVKLINLDKSLVYNLQVGPIQYIMQVGGNVPPSIVLSAAGFFLRNIYTVPSSLKIENPLFFCGKQHYACHPSRSRSELHYLRQVPLQPMLRGKCSHTFFDTFSVQLRSEFPTAVQPRCVLMPIMHDRGKAPTPSKAHRNVGMPPSLRSARARATLGSDDSSGLDQSLRTGFTTLQNMHKMRWGSRISKGTWTCLQ